MEWIYITLGFLGGVVFTILCFIALLIKLGKIASGGK